MKYRIPIPVLAVTYPIIAIFLVFLSVFQRSQRSHVEPAPWLNAATIGAAVYLGLSIIWVFLLRIQVRGALGDRIRAQGRDPAYFVGFAGMAIFICPVLFAWFLSLFGLDMSKLVMATGISLAGLLIWPWIYRHREERGDAA